ncbi:hypothetical protein BHM03_00051011 [Ensete ventricosum]|nr:hypothetical protein BHM03_00051011 [Ensete ventricosum]
MCITSREWLTNRAAGVFGFADVSSVVGHLQPQTLVTLPYLLYRSIVMHNNIVVAASCCNSPALNLFSVVTLLLTVVVNPPLSLLAVAAASCYLSTSPSTTPYSSPFPFQPRVVTTTPRTVIAHRTNAHYPASPLALLNRCCRPLLVEPSTSVVAPSVAYSPCSRRLSCLAYHSHRGRFPHQCHFLLDPLLLPEMTLLASSSNNAPSAISHSHCDIILAAITSLITSSSVLCRATSRVAFPSDHSSYTTLSLAAHRQKQASIFPPCNDQNRATSSSQPLPSSSFADCTNTVAPIPLQQP